MAGISPETAAAMESMTRQARELLARESAAIEELAKLRVRLHADGSHSIVFRVQEAGLLRELEDAERFYRGKARPPVSPRRAVYADGAATTRAIGHLLENCELDFGRLEGLSAKMSELRESIRAAGVTEDATRRIEDAIESLRRRRDFRLKAASGQLEKAGELLSEGNAGAACATLVACVNRVLARKRSAEQGIVPLNRRRLSLLEELAGLEERRKSVLEAGLRAVHREIGVSVRIRNAILRRDLPRGAKPDLTRLIAEIAASHNLLAARDAASRADQVSLLLKRIRGAPRNVESQLSLAKAHLSEGKLEEGRAKLQAAIGEAMRYGRGMLGWSDRRSLTDFLSLMRRLSERLPASASIREKISRASSEILERHGDIALAHQNLREAKETLEQMS